MKATPKKDYILLNQVLMLLFAIAIVLFWIMPDSHRAHAIGARSASAPECVAKVYEEECDERDD